MSGMMDVEIFIASYRRDARERLEEAIKPYVEALPYQSEDLKNDRKIRRAAAVLVNALLLDGKDEAATKVNDRLEDWMVLMQAQEAQEKLADALDEIREARARWKRKST